MKVQDLAFAHTRRGRRVLDAVTFLSDSRRIAILGPNGAGKSTLLNVLSTVWRPTAGFFVTDSYDSRDCDGLADFRARLGVVPQIFSAYGGLTGRELLGYVAWLRGMSTQQAADRTDVLLAALGLEEYSERKLKTYSGGTRQRLSLAQALVNDPVLLLLDEPTVSLDPAQREKYLSLLDTIPAPTTVVMTSHVVDDIVAFAEDVVVLRAGACLFSGPLTDFCSLPEGTAVHGDQLRRAYLHAVGGDSTL